MARIKYKRRRDMKTDSLPKNLSFLSNVNFYAIAVYQQDDKPKKTRIEFQISPLRKLVKLASQASKLKEKNKSLQEKLRETQEKLESIKQEYKTIKKNYDQLLENIEEDSDYETRPNSVYKSSFQLFEQASFTFITPCAGGSPGQGQKK